MDLNFRIRDLCNFVETAGSRTMLDAADKLGITQPSLSESIKRLEADLNRKVFYRSREGIQMTPSGRLLFQQAKKIIASLSEISSDDSEAGSTYNHTLIIGCHTAIGSILLPKILATFEKKAPGFRIELKHGRSRQIQQETQLGTIDIAFVVDPLPSQDLVVKHFVTEEICVWKSGDANSNKDRLICDLDIFQTHILLKQWKKCPTNIISSTSLELCTRLTHDGIGLGILPSLVVDMMNLSLKKVPNTPSYKDEVFVIYKPGFGKTWLERALLEAINGILPA